MARPRIQTSNSTAIKYDFEISRRITAEVCLKISSPSSKRVWGMPGAQCNRSLARAGGRSTDCMASHIPVGLSVPPRSLTPATGARNRNSYRPKRWDLRKQRSDFLSPSRSLARTHRPASFRRARAGPHQQSSSLIVHLARARFAQACLPSFSVTARRVRAGSAVIARQR